MIDFTNCPQRVNTYEGADFKRKIIYDGNVYMLKFGQKLESNDRKPLQASYSSAPVSEYIGSHIYGIIGIETQETMLGTYDGKVVVACRDFIESLPNAEKLALIEFKKLENSFLGSSSAGGRTPLYDNLIEIFASHDALADIRSEAEDRYWKMFAVDALIGNFDRHAGNWGYILNKSENRIVGLAPVYDCGSCLYPQLNEGGMRDLLSDRSSFEKRTMTFPTAALRLGKKKVNYHDFLLSPEGAGGRCRCRAAGQCGALREPVGGAGRSTVRRQGHTGFGRDVVRQLCDGSVCGLLRRRHRVFRQLLRGAPQHRHQRQDHCQSATLCRGGRCQVPVRLGAPCCRRL